MAEFPVYFGSCEGVKHYDRHLYVMGNGVPGKSATKGSSPLSTPCCSFACRPSSTSSHVAAFSAHVGHHSPLAVPERARRARLLHPGGNPPLSVSS